MLKTREERCMLSCKQTYQLSVYKNLYIQTINMWKWSVTFTYHLAFPLSRYYFPCVSDNWQPVGRISYQLVWSCPVPSSLSKLTWLSAAVAVCLVLGVAEAMSNMALLHYYLSQYQLLPEEDTDGQEICNGKPGMCCKEREKIALRQACFCIISLLKDILNIYKTCIWLLFTLEKVHIGNYATLNRRYRNNSFPSIMSLWIAFICCCSSVVVSATTFALLRFSCQDNNLWGLTSSDCFAALQHTKSSLGNQSNKTEFLSETLIKMWTYV